MAEPRIIVLTGPTATGKTALGVALAKKLGGEVVKLCFVMELAGLEGRKRLEGYDMESAIIYEGK